MSPDRNLVSLLAHSCKNLLAATLVVLAVTQPVAHADTGDERIIAAREALRTGASARLEGLAAASDPDHILNHYVDYWLLIDRLERKSDPVPSQELARFVDRHRNSIPADRLLDYWMRRLAQEQDWAALLKVFSEKEDPGEEVRCLAWQAGLMLGQREPLAEVSSAWRDLLDAHAACEPALRAAATLDEVSEDALWWRIQRQVDSRTPDNARTSINWLPVAQRPEPQDTNQALGSPAAWLDRLPPNFAVKRSMRELAIAALTRLARQDPLAAYSRFVRLHDRLSHQERAYVFSVLAHHAALSRLPQAYEWYRAAGDAQMSPAQREWAVRAALRQQQWHDVERAIADLEEDTRSQPVWLYWLARARAAQGHQDEAEALLRKIAERSDFHGLLAAETLGRRFTPPGNDEPVSAEARNRALADPGLNRALTFYRIGLNTEAVREWISALRGKDRGFLLAAAHIAQEHGLLDRAINTAELADPEANFQIRFPMPFRELIEPQARGQGLEPGWVYGVMRQESRFVIPARSHAGAQGLMQVIPDTGRWVARQIGMSSYHPRMLNDPHSNVVLGTNYMRIIMAGLDNNPVLTSAGYNAGPGRARRWRDTKDLDATIYIETIPFDETRDYVKKVLANAVIYTSIIEGQPQSIARWLATVPAAPGSD